MSSLSVVEGSVSATTNTTGPATESQPKHCGDSTTASTDAAATTTTTTLDFIASSNAVKDLFSLPYASDRPISVAVHNLDGTLLIDTDPDGLVQELNTAATTTKAANRDGTPSTQGLPRTKQASRPLPEDDAWHTVTDEEDMTRSLVALSSLEPKSEALTIVNSIIETTRREKRSQRPLTAATGSGVRALGVPQPDEYVHNYIPPAPEPREYVQWSCQDMNLLVGSEALVYRSPDASTALTVRVEDATNMRVLQEQHAEMVRSGKFVADHHLAKMEQMGKLSYAQAVLQSKTEQLEEEIRVEEKSKVEQQQKKENFAVPDLGQVRLQTCIVPAPISTVGGLLTTPSASGALRPGSKHLSPVSTVIDAYLDNIMANVPQLALCLQEKGFIQSVKLLRTDDIPAGLMHPSTLDTSSPFDVFNNDPEIEKMFSPQIMEMNASALLRFLKSNCTKDNATYLLRREAGQTNIQLYDISSISAQRQRKWTWWLATMSYRFALRLRHLSLSSTENALSRSFRARQRSLLQNSLDLLDVLSDMDGVAHESLVAAIRENLADTFLGMEEGEAALPERPEKTQPSNPPSVPESVTSASSQQPYGAITVDALNKAHDHLAQSIKILWPVLEENVPRVEKSARKAHKGAKSPRVRVVSIEGNSSDSDDSFDEGKESTVDPSNSPPSLQVDAVTTQLFGLHHKLVNVSLRLAEIHLRNYYSASAMQALRNASRRIADSLYLVRLLGNDKDGRQEDWIQRLQFQYTWLWEYCGHFARSFAADEHWRDRGHASGDDVCSTLRDVEAAFVENKHLKAGIPRPFYRYTKPGADPLSRKSNGMTTLASLSPIVDCQSSNSGEIKVSESHDAMISAAKDLIDKQGLLRRDERKVLVAACISYNRAIDALCDLMSRTEEGENAFGPNVLDLLQKRFGDACNETGKVLLTELRNLLSSPKTDTSGNGSLQAADPLLSSAVFWFLEGLEAFQACRDLRNIALLRCNLCQCYKLRANNMFAPPRGAEKVVADGPTHAEACLQQAADHLQAAHVALGQREVDPMTWDMVSTELAATFLVLGVRRRQSLIGSGTVPMLLQALRLSPGKERSIVEPMEQALAIYQQAGNLHQAAAAHYQLALFYSKIWTCQRDETKTREKLSAAFEHYNAALFFFSRNVQGNEATFCLLCLDVSSLYAAVAGEECLAKALLRCLDTIDAFSERIIATVAQMQPVATRTEWFQRMSTLAESVEERVFKLLRNLVKLEEEEKNAATAIYSSSKYKDIYRLGLGIKMAATIQTDVTTNDPELDETVCRLLKLRKVLHEIQTQLEPAKDTNIIG